MHNFKIISSIEIRTAGGFVIDLHNYYAVREVEYKEAELKIHFYKSYFNPSIIDKSPHNVTLTFTGVEIKKFKAAFEMYNKGLEERGYAMPDYWEEEYLIDEKHAETGYHFIMWIGEDSTLRFTFAGRCVTYGEEAS